MVKHVEQNQNVIGCAEHKAVMTFNNMLRMQHEQSLTHYPWISYLISTVDFKHSFFTFSFTLPRPLDFI